MVNIFFRILAVILAVVSFFTTSVTNIDSQGFTKIAYYACTSFAKPETSDEIDEYLEKTGGIVKGICHPNENFEQIAQANIEWVRFDLTSMPFDADGNLTDGYKNYKARAKSYADNGFKVMCITPYPSKYINAGIDPRTDEGKEKIREIIRFYATDLKGIVSAFQITNEMGVEHFTLPLTLEQAAEFIGIQLEAIKDIKGDIVAGFNLASTTMYNFCKYMKPYLDYCDYVGIDIYLGCFENVFKDLWVNDALLRYVWSYTGKPVMLNEFGYIGYGVAKTKAEKTEILQSYGYNSEAEARADIFNFVDKFPKKFREHMLGLEYANGEELAAKLFDTEVVNHLYRELPGGYTLRKYPHTPQGQGEFFTDAIARFEKLDFVVGAFVYCYSDSDSCYICGQSDCPVETGWGLVDGNGNPKPSYYAVQSAFAKWNR